MAQPKVFVSHSSKGIAFAEWLVEHLRAAGAHAWLDKEDLGANDPPLLKRAPAQLM